MEFGWRVIVGSVIGFFAVVFGSLGDDRGDGIFAPMLILIIGFDPKTSTAISVCKYLHACLVCMLTCDKCDFLKLPGFL